MPSSLSQFPSDGTTTSHRVRHLSAIQICNLSPFPARDSLASALALPSEQSQFSSHGKLSDDLDITIGRRRPRRISSSSNVTTRSIRWEQDKDKARPAESSSKRGPSSPSRSPVHGDSPTSSRKRSFGPGSSPSIRPSRRPRAMSTVSVVSSLYDPTTDAGTSASAFVPTFLRDTSQGALEHVFQSRLIETYVTVTIPKTQKDGLPNSASSSAVFPDAHSTSSLSSAGSVHDRKPSPNRGHSATKSMFSIPAASPKMPTLSPKTALPNGRQFGSHSKSMSMSFPSTDKVGSGSHPRTDGRSPLLPNSASGAFETPNPAYRSTVHRPSTNPCFTLDVRSEFGHLDHVDLSGNMLHIELWGNLPVSHRDDTTRDRPHSIGSASSWKGKQKDSSGSSVLQKEWRILEQWDIDVTSLVPLPDESHLRQLPFNTLVLTLNPPGRRYYIPPNVDDDHTGYIPRSASPSVGYNSDPESDLRKVTDISLRHDEEKKLRGSSRRFDLDEQATSPQSASALAKQEGKRLTANWQDLLKLTTVQTVILDTKQSLSEVVQVIDQLVLQHPTKAPNREASERRAYIRELEAEKGSALDECQNLRDQIDSKREALRIRRRVLREALQAVEDEQQRQSENEKLAAAERNALLSLRSQLPPLRSSALAILASIYPIELVSPPDLLFAIVDVPLPIPVGTTDPAPPLSLPTFKDINEDTIATALGFAAHVVHLLAAYMSKNLVYPITYIGSRSLIKDGISAMVGPRMFPLFSKGIDTYRFEYAVFLLNKNIEMLMSDRDLRALDMRHTLPNLKNLLLTLTDPDSIPNKRIRPEALSGDSGLRSPSTLSSMLSEEDAAERNEESQADADADRKSIEPSTTPTAGSMTPTQTTVRKSRAFLDLGPLTGFLRSRYPSTTSRSATNIEADAANLSATSTTTAAGEAQDASPSREGDADDEDDRRTIRDARSEVEVGEGKEDEGPHGQDDAGGAAPAITQVAAGDSLEKLKTGATLMGRGQVVEPPS